MLKNIIILILVVTVSLFWLGADLNEDEFDDSNIVIIEYNCNILDQYEDVPSEVIRECSNRTELTKNKI
jgi:hypothetical protein